jgi:hypothetical protein
MSGPIAFTPDGALVLMGLPEDHPLAGRFEGAAALAAFAKTAFTSNVE